MHQTDRLSFFLFARWHDIRTPIKPLSADFIIAQVSNGHRRRPAGGLKWVNALATPFLNACYRWQDARQRYRAVRHLNQLSNHQLADIGLERNQIREAVNGILAKPARGTIQARLGSTTGRSTPAPRFASTPDAVPSPTPAVEKPQDAVA